MLIRVCILLQIQPAPLTGTATALLRLIYGPGDRIQPAPLTGTATVCVCVCVIQPAPLTGTATRICAVLLTPFIDSARTPHGDSNNMFLSFLDWLDDAACAPHGDSNMFGYFAN